VIHFLILQDARETVEELINVKLKFTTIFQDDRITNI